MNSVNTLLSVLQNGYRFKKSFICLNYCKYYFNFFKLLYRLGYIRSFFYDSKKIYVLLKYKHKIPAIQKVKQISKSGNRCYYPVEKIPKFKNSFGIYILSTSRGLLSDNEARLLNVGGEVVCKIH